MTILRDILYFAPTIPFREVALESALLPGQFKCRIAGFYIAPAEQCAKRNHAIAAGLLLVCCIDALARLRFGDGVGQRFIKFAREQLQSFQNDPLARSFYDEFRNGLVHEGRPKNGAQFSLARELTGEEVDGILLVNPKLLAAEVRRALDAYVNMLTRDHAERGKLAARLGVDLAEDLRLTHPGGAAVGEPPLATRPLKPALGEKRRSELGPGVSPPGRIARHRGPAALVQSC
jgi:hypothetical protein